MAQDLATPAPVVSGAGARVWLSAGVCMAALALRSPGLQATLVAALVGGAAVAAPMGHPVAGARPGRRWAGVVALGIAAFALVRWVPGFVPVPFGLPFAAGATLAAVAEEAVFRRLLYDRLLGHGPAVAVVVGALAFAVVHVPTHGAATVPLNVAAGLVLGWQRRAAGSWSAPAVTHAAANLLALG